MGNDERGQLMDNIREVIVWIIGICIAATMLVVMAFVGLAAVGFFVVIVVASFVVTSLRGRRSADRHDGPVARKDKHGTIIDM